MNKALRSAVCSWPYNSFQVITECDDEISARGIELLREVCTCVGPQLSAAHHHEAFLTQCCARTQRMQKEMEAHEGIPFIFIDLGVGKIIN